MAKTPWVEWRGGEIPVGPDVLVEVRFMSDGPVTKRKASEFRWLWTADGRGGDIIAYRVAS